MAACRAAAWVEWAGWICNRGEPELEACFITPPSCRRRDYFPG
jgi:hypothetical protein